MIETKSSKEDLNRVPHPSHRHAAPSAPWPWVDLDDGLWFPHAFDIHVFRQLSFLLIKFTEVDRKQLESVEPPIPEHCDHNPGRCNRCWTGYPQSRFPNWTERQVKKAKIYDVVHNYSRSKPCICYLVDVNDCGYFTHPNEIVAVHGEEDAAWEDMIHEQVS